MASTLQVRGYPKIRHKSPTSEGPRTWKLGPAWQEAHGGPQGKSHGHHELCSCQWDYPSTAKQMEVSWNAVSPKWMVCLCLCLSWKIILKWMIWGGFPILGNLQIGTFTGWWGDLCAERLRRNLCANKQCRTDWLSITHMSYIVIYNVSYCVMTVCLSNIYIL